MGNYSRPLRFFGFSHTQISSGRSTALCALSFFLGVIPLGLPSARNLEYEYSLILANLAVIMLPLAGLFFLESKASRDFGWRNFFVMLSCPIFMTLPGLIFFRLGFCGCSEPGFFFWMILQVYPAALLGVGGFMLICQRRKEGASVKIVFGVILALIVMSLLALWFFPQKRIISPALGFLHGPIYDRWIPVDSGVVFGRLCDGLLGLVIMLAVQMRIKLNSKRFLTALCTILLVRAQVFFAPSGGHGFWALDRVLSSEIKGVDVSLRYARSSSSDDQRALTLLRDAEFYVSEIKRDLGAEISNPIKIYAYKNEDQKKALFGGGDTDVADVWTPSVHVELSESPHPTLRHELVHAVASFVSWFDIGFHPNMMFTEGLAMALAPIDQETDFDIISASLLKSGRLKQPENLLNPIGFWSESGGPAYLAAGSFLRWMVRQYGREAIKKIYSGVSVKSAVGVAEVEVFKAWQQQIMGKYNASKDLIVEKFARDPGVLNDFCPHSIVDMMRPRSEGLLVRLRQPMGWDPERLLDWQVERMPGRRPLESARLSRDIKSKLKDGFFDMGALDVFIESTIKGRRSPPETVEDMGLMLLQSDLEILRNSVNVSRSIIVQAGGLFVEKDPGTLLRRQHQVRIGLLNAGLPLPVHKEWLKYLMGVNAIPPGGDDASWVVKYLRARRENHPTSFQLAEWRLHAMSLSDFPDIQREWLKVVAHGYAKNQEYTQAQLVYDELSALLSGDAKLLAQEHSRRMLYLQNRMKL